DESFQLWQPQGQVSVSVGQTLTLHCTVSKHAMAGPVKWLKAFGSSKQIVYDQKGPLPRVTRAVNESNTNYTIHISKVRVEDAGTYYCVKFKKGEEQDEEYSSGAGTEVFVHGEWCSRLCHGPPEQLPAGKRPRRRGCPPSQRAPGRAGLGGGPAPPPLPRPRSLPTAGASRQLGGARRDRRSEHPAPEAVSGARRGEGARADAGAGHRAPLLFAVPPTVRVLPDLPNPVEVNKTVNFTCSAEGFYPDAVTLTWLENGVEANAGSPPHLTETSQGTFELRSLLEVQATEEKNQSVFTCRVVHDSQSPVSSAVTLQIAVPAAD
ncbi:SIRBL protein, partial [Dromaius novaehollandiae]|nr:SIRBL protein [Dromaius novaehollandiae]